MHDFRGIAATAGSSQDVVTVNLQLTADGAHVAAVQSDVSSQAGRNTQKALLLKCCAALDVSAELTQLQHLNKFALTERPIKVMYSQMVRWSSSFFVAEGHMHPSHTSRSTYLLETSCSQAALTSP